MNVHLLCSHIVDPFLIGKRLWGFPNFHSDCATGYWRFMSGSIVEQKEYITGICNQMMHQLHHIYDPEKVFLLA